MEKFAIIISGDFIGTEEHYLFEANQVEEVHKWIQENYRHITIFLDPFDQWLDKEDFDSEEEFYSAKCEVFYINVLSDCEYLEEYEYEFDGNMPNKLFKDLVEREKTINHLCKNSKPQSGF